MTLEAGQKIRMLASADLTLQGIFGTNPFRWFDTQEAQGYIEQGPCCRWKHVSSIFLHAQQGITDAEQARLQFDFLAKTPGAAWDAMQAFMSFLDGVNLMTDQNFTSPPTTPTQHPNFLLTTGHGIEYRTERQIYVWSCDYRIWNNLSI